MARLGGDEFLLILSVDNTRKENIEMLADKIIECISGPIKVTGFEPLTVGVSIGIAFAKDFNDLDALITAADNAMYKVKNAGKNNYSFAL